jgi:hypothetical protein
LYERVEKEKDVEEKVKILHEDGIFNCFMLTKLLRDTLIDLAPFFSAKTKTDLKRLFIFLSHKEKVYFDDKQIEKMIK